MTTNFTRSTLLALLLIGPSLAQAVPEAESNHPAAMAQTLAIGDIVADGVATTGAIVDGVIGVNSGAAVLDFDYYVFEGQAGDVVTLDIDLGWDGVRRVDTVMAIFGPAPVYKVLAYNDDSSPVDPGSMRVGTSSTRDSRINSFRLPAAGQYTVGVAAYQSSQPLWTDGAKPIGTTVGTNGNGDYALIVSGVTPPVMQISIEVKPGSGDVAPINPKSRGKVPVALMGSDEFIVDEVDTATLTFGHSGTEASLSKCGAASDVNGDVFPDMVCHFENQAAAWAPTDEEGILRGKLNNGKKFEGRAWLKVVPVKAEE